jgi:hypothetical protein
MSAIKTEKCVIDRSKFDFKNIRYYCESCKRFLCAKCSTSEWVYETTESKDKERPVCRCHDCGKKIDKAREELEKAMSTMDFHTVDKVYSMIL